MSGIFIVLLVAEIVMLVLLGLISAVAVWALKEVKDGKITLRMLQSTPVYGSKTIDEFEMRCHLVLLFSFTMFWSFLILTLLTAILSIYALA